MLVGGRAAGCVLFSLSDVSTSLPLISFFLSFFKIEFIASERNPDP
jgi:hypothetical protein